MHPTHTQEEFEKRQSILEDPNWEEVKEIISFVVLQDLDKLSSHPVLAIVNQCAVYRVHGFDSLEELRRWAECQTDQGKLAFVVKDKRRVRFQFRLVFECEGCC